MNKEANFEDERREKRGDDRAGGCTPRECSSTVFHTVDSGMETGHSEEKEEQGCVDKI